MWTVPRDLFESPTTTRRIYFDVSFFENVFFTLARSDERSQKFLKLFLCRPFSQTRRFFVNDYRVARDVTRAPGGDVARFNEMPLCHGIIDALRPAFARFDWNPSAPTMKEEFRTIATPNNLATNPQDSMVESIKTLSFIPWDSSPLTDNGSIQLSSIKMGASAGMNVADGGQTISFRQGNGARELGLVLGHTDAFGQCMAKRVFVAVCKRDLAVSEEATVIGDLVTAFAQSGYKLGHCGRLPLRTRHAS